jgi:hypothetical protein
VIGQGGASPSPPLIYRDGLLFSGGGAAIKSRAPACGTPPVAFGNLAAGYVFFDSTYTRGTTCTITFNGGFPPSANDPVCVTSVFMSAISATAPTPPSAALGGLINFDTLQIISTTTGNHFVSWICFGVFG